MQNAHLDGAILSKTGACAQAQCQHAGRSFIQETHTSLQTGSGPCHLFPCERRAAALGQPRNCCCKSCGGLTEVQFVWPPHSHSRCRSCASASLRFLHRGKLGKR
ncbi:hypothetical protein JL2886_02541 [Phaeobacter gallaeciensis]|uniref:Uncharacterized protein n=1 Tax=Phaeobacter gallaeciensis TaxID=60890 RepID=A0A1B0ZTJ2_9RHOB|nr:hypothetical protein JL2886_02541 [Phaeobacter gallaeciensis]